MSRIVPARNNAPGLQDRSERYGYDNLNRLTLMERGVLNADGTAVTTPLDHPRLAREQQWVDLDRRGNWRDYRWVESPSGTPTTRQQTRQVNGVNEYTAIDPDGTPPPGSPPNSPPVALQHDAAGKSLGEVVVTDGGVTVLEESYLCPFTVDQTDRRIGWTAREFDELGRVEQEYRSNGTQVDTQYADCCREWTVTDETGVVTTYTRDILGRLQSSKKEAAAPITNSYAYAYDNLACLITTVVSGGDLTLSTSRRVDLAGRPMFKTNEAGLTTTYGYAAASGGGRKVTTIHPGGAEEVTEYNRDRGDQERHRNGGGGPDLPVRSNRRAG